MIRMRVGTWQAVKLTLCAVAAMAIGVSPLAVAQTQKAATPERIELGGATTSAVRKGSVRGYSYVDYVVNLAAGQALSVSLASKSGFLYFNVLDKDTMVALETDPAPREVTEWHGQIPKGGDYVIRVYLVRAEARRNRKSVPYSLTVSSATVEGQAPAKPAR